MRRSGVGYFFGAYDVHADVLFGGYRLAKSTTEVLAFYKSIRRRYPEHLRIQPGQRQPLAALDTSDPWRMYAYLATPKNRPAAYQPIKPMIVGGNYALAIEADPQTGQQGSNT